MAGQLIPPPEIAPQLRPGLTREQRIAAWFDLMTVCDKFLLAGLQRTIGPEGDLKAALRDWYAEQMEEHDQKLLHLLEQFARREGSHAH